MFSIVFPGQGAQYKGMGIELFDQYEKLCTIADDILGYSIKKLCIEDPNNHLNLTQYTQPALFIVNALYYYQQQKSNPIPSYLAGHSLGEYNALLAAGIFDFETGLKLVQKRGELMSHEQNGAMLAIIRSCKSHVDDILQKRQLTTIDIANYNSPSQFVLSGNVQDINTAKSIFEEENVFCIPLKVSGAFHSRKMKNAAKKYEGFLQKIEFNQFDIPVISNITGLPYKKDQIKKMLVRQLYESVQWVNTIRYLIALKQDINEVGPGNILTKLNEEITKDAEPLDIQKIKPIEMKKSFSEKPRDKQLGSKEFLSDYKVQYPYIAGSMCNGISSSKLVVRMAKSGFLAFLGATGLSINEIELLIKSCKKELTSNQIFGVNVHYTSGEIVFQQQLINICIKENVPCIEVSGFDHINSDLVKYRAKGLVKRGGEILIRNKILVKTSNSKAAEIFMQPAPLHVLEKLLSEEVISKKEFELSKHIPMADDICVEGDSGWKTDQTVTLIKLPEIIQLRDKYHALFTQSKKIRIGSSGGIGTPQAIVAVITLGADFVLTGSINQCTVEAGISDFTKLILQNIQPDDTSHILAGDQFESGAKVQVVRKGTFFAARAQKLYDLYRLHDNWDVIDIKVRQQIEKHFFNCSFESIYHEIKNRVSGNESKNIGGSHKYKMEEVFKWYFKYSCKLAIVGNKESVGNFQIFCGPALGAFNQLVKGGHLEKWQNRHVDDIAKYLLKSAKNMLKISTVA